ncbi:CAP-Gly domain-containing linker protein 4 [Schistosoma japonicum]|nr:CAP-Gly domain-containing linker protein 4 [Schistosoma japonicum]
MTWDCLVSVVFGVILRYLVRKYASTNFLDSLTYSSLDQWDSVNEGIYLQKHGISAYDGDVVHQPPLLLLLWSYLLKLTNGDGSIYFLALEFISLVTLFVFCESTLSYLLSIQRGSKSSVHDSSKHLLLNEKYLKRLQGLSVIWYSLNPYSILVSAAQSTIIIYNIIFLWINIAICKGQLILAAIFCAVGCYIRIYPGYLIFPVLAARYLQSSNKSKTIATRLSNLLPPLVAFTVSISSLLWISYIIQNHDWSFLTSVYWNTQNPLYICLVISFVINVLQPYHNIGELGLLISILPMWSHLLKQTRLLLISACCLLTALILSPLFHYIWLQPGTANANFYFAASLVHAFGQVILITDLLNAQGKYEFLLRYGSKLKLSTGEKLKLLECQNRLTGLASSCAPSPRTVARSSSSSLLRRTGQNGYYKQQCNGFDNTGIAPTDVDDDEVDRLFYKPRRSHPVSHPPTEIPFCENCRVMDEEMSKEYDSVTGSPVNNSADEMIHDEEDESRSCVMRMPIGPWWCEDCQESVTSSNLNISQLFAILRQWTPYAQLQLITIVEEIFRRGAHVDDRDGLSDMTLLHFAAKSGALGDEKAACRIANYLLDEGASLEARCKWTDMTPLHYAAYFDCPLLADLLIDRGACISARSFLIDNSTPLHLAASQLSLGTARILIQAADFSVTKTGQRYDAKHAKDGYGRTPYECLPPSGQLPEPLCTLRDLLAELLRPTSPQQSDEMEIEKKIIQATSNDPTDYRSEQTGQIPPIENHHSQPQSACNGVEWLVAESGFLSPRTKRSPPTIVQQQQQQPLNNGMKSPTTLHSKKFTISAKVTLQSMGLALGDRVCIAPGNSTTPPPSVAAGSNTNQPTTGITGRIGKLRYCGSVSFGSGIWVGVELDEPVGRNNGSVAGIQYFSCPNQHGIFAPIGRVYKTVNVNGKQNWHPVTQNSSSIGRSSTPHLSTTPNTSRKLKNLKEDIETGKGEGGSCSSSSTSGSNTPRKHIPSSRSSYSISSAMATSIASVVPNKYQTVSSELRRTPTPPTSITVQSPVNFTHVTAKIDTGLRIRSPDVGSRNHLFQIGDRVLVAGQRKGILRFIGQTQFAPGIWYGVELEQPVGKNNGSINGIRYFDCAVGHGIFAPINRIQKIPVPPSTPNLHCASLKSPVDNSMTTSCHSEQVDGAPNKSWCRRMPWSSTTSPMIGRAVIGRPPLPTELINALKAVGRVPTESIEEPVFYLTEGMQVLCAGEIGIVRYIGPITFAEGIWLGVELRKPRGRHDGCVAGKRYFTCRPGHGLLVRPSRVFCHGINAINLLPPALAELELQLAAKRHEMAAGSSSGNSRMSSANSINSCDEQSLRNS